MKDILRAVLIGLGAVLLAYVIVVVVEPRKAKGTYVPHNKLVKETFDKDKDPYKDGTDREWAAMDSACDYKDSMELYLHHADTGTTQGAVDEAFNKATYFKRMAQGIITRVMAWRQARGAKN